MLRKGISNVMLVFFLFIAPKLYSNTDTIGFLEGILLINSSWEPIVYLSKILNFDEMYSITNDMIVTQTSIDSLGNFLIDLNFLPKEET